MYLASLISTRGFNVLEAGVDQKARGHIAAAKWERRSSGPWLFSFLREIKLGRQAQAESSLACCLLQC